jgi:hypothetical protein
MQVSFFFFFLFCGRYCSYHDNAFLASRVLHIINIHNSSAMFRLLEEFFKHQVTSIFGYLCLERESWFFIGPNLKFNRD